MEKQYKFSDELRVSGIRSGGYGQLPKIVMLDPDLSAESKAIYAYFASYTGGGNVRAFPGRDKIVHDLAVTKDTYYRHFRPLVENGYISVEQSNGGASGKGFSHNIYTLENFPEKYGTVPEDANERLFASLSQIKATKDISAAGYGNIPKTVMTDTTLPLSAKAVYAYLCVFSGENCQASPSKTVAMFHLGISSNSYSKYMKILEQKDYISRVQSQSGGQFGNVIFFLNQSPSSGQDEKTAEIPEDSPYTNFSYTVFSDTVKPDTEKSYTVLSDTENPDTNTTSAPTRPKKNINGCYQSVFRTRTPKETSPGVSGRTDAKNPSEILSDISEAQGIPEAYLGDSLSVSGALNVLSDISGDETFTRFRAVCISVLTEMLCAGKGGTRINGVGVSPEEILKTLNASLERKNSEDGTAGYSLGKVLEGASERYIKYGARKEISNPESYIKSILLTEMRTAGLAVPEDKSEEDKDSNSSPLPKSVRNSRR